MQPVCQNLSRFFPSENTGIQNVDNFETKGVFYQIDSSEGTVGYLLGTIHSATEQILHLNVPIHSALEKANAIYIEVIQQEKLSEPEMEKYVSAIGSFSPVLKDNLKDFFALAWPKIYANAQEIKGLSVELNFVNERFFIMPELDQCTNLNQMISCVERFRAELFYINKYNETIGKETPEVVSLEQLLSEYAKATEKTLLPLEEATSERFQLIELEPQYNDFTADWIEDLPSTEEEVERFLFERMERLKKACLAWTVGDEEQLSALEVGPLEKNPKRYSKMVTERNGSMANKIDEVLRAQPEGFLSIFAPGVSHVPGIKTLLEQKGWQLKRVLPA